MSDLYFFIAMSPIFAGLAYLVYQIIKMSVEMHGWIYLAYVFIPVASFCAWFWFFAFYLGDLN